MVLAAAVGPADVLAVLAYDGLSEVVADPAGLGDRHVAYTAEEARALIGDRLNVVAQARAAVDAMPPPGDSLWERIKKETEPRYGRRG